MRTTNVLRRTIAASFLTTLAFAASATVTTLTLNQFSSLTSTGWTIGAQAGGTVSVSKDTTQNYNGQATSIVGSYPAPTGGVYVWGAYDVSALKTEDLYVEFWAKMPKTKYGLKFLKIFGGNNGGQANTTFGLDYTGIDNGYMAQVSFGDGSSTSNDAQNVIHFDGTYPEWVGRSYSVAKISAPQKSIWSSTNWGTSWHHFKFHVKFNSGTTASNEVADGAYYVEIDGKIYVDATGIFNRHYSNPPIDRVELFGWSQGGTAPFEIWYSNVNISTGGFASSSSTSTTTTAAPSAPSLSVQPK